MKTQEVKVQGFGGPQYTNLPADGEMIEFDRDVSHGDWKTASVFPDRWPTIPKGTKVKMVGWMQNLYGVFVRVEHNGERYDIEDFKVKGLRR